ncbi:hypothetical protein [Dyella ginsengisoli]|uniref:hypothetical protein n=1 Tax=Dyella ginsengisoli TaxID=363848 RepID=UPI00384B9131
MADGDAVAEQFAQGGARGGQVAGVVGEAVDDAAPQFASARQELGGLVVAQLGELGAGDLDGALGGEQLALGAGGDDARLDRRHDVGMFELGLGEAPLGAGFIRCGLLECLAGGALEVLERCLAEQLVLDGGEQGGIGARTRQAHAP